MYKYDFVVFICIKKNENDEETKKPLLLWW